ncbi:collagen alpha-1(I) chain-like [Anas acuta]|uniref:collagen alpha-1(I) chain-like n=1 Tax=Anas acuta TaxID=28680 RepID=UPI0035C8B997
MGRPQPLSPVEARPRRGGAGRPLAVRRRRAEPGAGAARGPAALGGAAPAGLPLSPPPTPPDPQPRRWAPAGRRPGQAAEEEEEEEEAAGAADRAGPPGLELELELERGPGPGRRGWVSERRGLAGEGRGWEGRGRRSRAPGGSRGGPGSRGGAGGGRTGGRAPGPGAPRGWAQRGRELCPAPKASPQPLQEDLGCGGLGAGCTGGSGGLGVGGARWGRPLGCPCGEGWVAAGTSGPASPPSPAGCPLGAGRRGQSPPVPPVHPPWTRHSRPRGCGVTAGWELEDRGVRAGHHGGVTSPLTAPTGPPARNPLLFRGRFVPSASPAPRGSSLTVSSAFIHASLQPAWRGEPGAARWRRGLVPKSCPFILPGAASASPSACRDAAPCAASIAQPPAGAVLRGAFQQAARPRGWGERVWGTPPGSQPPSRPEHGGAAS